MKNADSDQIKIPESALDELKMVENMNWENGVSLAELIDWINAVVAMYLPNEKDSRSSPNFTIRSFRHYQTLGCIDSPERAGKYAFYGFRHYLQALLVRKFLWERMPSEQIVNLLRDKSNEEYKNLLLQGIEIVPQFTDSATPSPEVNQPPTDSETWRRKTILPGVEIHVLESRLPLTGAEIKQVGEAVKNFLKDLKPG